MAVLVLDKRKRAMSDGFSRCVGKLDLHREMDLRGI